MTRGLFSELIALAFNTAQIGLFWSSSDGDAHHARI